MNNCFQLFPLMEAPGLPINGWIWGCLRWYLLPYSPTVNGSQWAGKFCSLKTPIDKSAKTPKVSICTRRLGKEIQIAQLMHLRLKLFIVVTDLSLEVQQHRCSDRIYRTEITMGGADSLDVCSSDTQTSENSLSWELFQYSVFQTICCLDLGQFNTF